MECLIVRALPTLQMRPFYFWLAKMLENVQFQRWFFGKIFWGHSPQTPILGRGYGAPSQTPPPSSLRRFAPPAPRSGPSVPPSSGRDMGWFSPYQSWNASGAPAQIHAWINWELLCGLESAVESPFGKFWLRTWTHVSDISVATGKGQLWAAAPKPTGH